MKSDLEQKEHSIEGITVFILIFDSMFECQTLSLELPNMPRHPGFIGVIAARSLQEKGQQYK